MMHLLLIFKTPTDDYAIVEPLKTKNIACSALSNYYIDHPKQAGLILGFANANKGRITFGVSVIRECLCITNGL